jgi:hypothetical protein
MQSHMVCINIMYGRTTTKYAVTYGVCIRYFWQGNHQIYGQIRRICTVLANPTHTTHMPTKTHLELPLASCLPEECVCGVAHAQREDDFICMQVLHTLHVV